MKRLLKGIIQLLIKLSPILIPIVQKELQKRSAAKK